MVAELGLRCSPLQPGGPIRRSSPIGVVIIVPDFTSDESGVLDIMIGINLRQSSLGSCRLKGSTRLRNQSRGDTLRGETKSYAQDNDSLSYN